MKPITTPEEALAAVQQNGYNIRLVPEAMRTKAVCLAAVQQNGYAIDFVPEAMRKKIQIKE